MKDKNGTILKIVIPILALIVIVVAAYELLNLNSNEDSADTDNQSAETESDENSTSDDGEDDAASDTQENAEIRISTVGDIMVHDEQYWGAYVEETDSYDFNPVFQFVKPYLEEADIAIGNFETTLAGEERGYAGYPLFNAPDEMGDALQEAGFDSLVTSNNHIFDMGPDGLTRTVQELEGRDMDVIGTYDSPPESRHVIKEVDGIKVAMLAFTEHLNGMDADYPDEEVHQMVDVISEDNLTSAVEAAQADEPDVILVYMHWGPEYVEEPSDGQKYYAQYLADLGVDLIIGSHPHVIQRAEYIESGDHTAFNIYSMGNFVSNQRVETISEEFAPNEDGVIMNFDIEKDFESGETTIKEVSYVPTWVYRYSDTGERPFNYEILPVEDFQGNTDLPDDILERLDRSIERTHQRLQLDGGPSEE